MGVQELERAVSHLSRGDLQAFRSWFADFDAEAWDRQLETDVAKGRLDGLATEALNDLRRNRTSDL